MEPKQQKNNRNKPKKVQFVLHFEAYKTSIRIRQQFTDPDLGAATFSGVLTKGIVSQDFVACFGINR
jgi:hypothetical protein